MNNLIDQCITIKLVYYNQMALAYSLTEDVFQAVREEARKRRHEVKKKQLEEKQLKEKIKQFEKGKEKSKKDKLLRDSANKHKVR